METSPQKLLLEIFRLIAQAVSIRARIEESGSGAKIQVVIEGRRDSADPLPREIEDLSVVDFA